MKRPTPTTLNELTQTFTNAARRADLIVHEAGLGGYDNGDYYTMEIELPDGFRVYVEIRESEDDEYLEERYFKDEEDDTPVPEDGDYVMFNSGPLGSMTSLCQYNGAYIGEYLTEADALTKIEQKTAKEQFFPNVWRLTDHGNYVLLP